MISLAITTYNRCGLTIKSFEQVVNNDLVGEIVIVDDCSNMRMYNRLCVLTGNNKVKIYRNSETLGAYLNKREVISRCTYDWVILFDSDNIIKNNYILIADKLSKEADVIYIPELSYKENCEISIDNREFTETISKKNVRFDPKFLMLLNNGNWLVNRKRYLEVYDNTDGDPGCYAADSIYISYLWLKAGNRIKTIPANYIHRIHAGSYWNNNAEVSEVFLSELIEKMKKW